MPRAASDSLHRLFSELEQLFQNERREMAEHLNQSVRRLREATEFGEMASILADASAPFAERCTIFQVRDQSMAGECLRGADAATANRFREVQFALEEAAAFAAALESRGPVTALCSAAEISPRLVEFFQPAPEDRVHLFAVGTAGVICAAGAVDSAGLELLAQSATMVLEAVREAWERQAANAPATLVQITPPQPAWETLSAQERNLQLRAQRFARVQVAEMRLYRGEAVEKGRAQRDLYTALQDSIDQARETYRQTFLAESPTTPDYFHQELVRTLAHDDAAALGEKYPGPLT